MGHPVVCVPMGVPPMDVLFVHDRGVGFPRGWRWSVPNMTMKPSWSGHPQSGHPPPVVLGHPENPSSIGMCMMTCIQTNPHLKVGAMRRLFLILIFSSMSGAVFGQESQDRHVEATRQTEAEKDSRFQIIQSDLAVRLTFRLDRYTGTVHQLVKDREGNSAWQLMETDKAPTFKVPFHPRFQIFLSGLAARFTFLLDNDSGQTWQLVQATTTSADGSKSVNESWQFVP